MNHRQKPRNPPVRNPAYRQAFARLEEALEENTVSDNTEKIRQMRAVMFADVDAVLASGQLILPK